MARSRPLTIRRPNTQEDVHRVYAVDQNSTPKGCCKLDDGSTVLCAFETISVALEALSMNPSLQLVRHRSLNSQEQERVETALLA